MEREGEGRGGEGRGEKGRETERQLCRKGRLRCKRSQKTSYMSLISNFAAYAILRASERACVLPYCVWFVCVCVQT